MIRFLPLVFLFIAACAVPPTPERPPLSRHLDAVLGPRSSPVEDGVSLGSTGRRLRAERMDRKPGFIGRFHYLHQPSLEGSLYRLEISEKGRPVTFPLLTHQWWPSHIGMEGKADGLHLVERKFISKEDRAIDLVTLRNESGEDRDLQLQVTSELRFTKGLRGTLSRADKDYDYFLRAEGFLPELVSRPVHGAFNPDRSSDVQPRASFTWNSDSMWAPIDGEKENLRRWTCWSSGNKSDWYEVEFPQDREINQVVLHLVMDRAGISAPAQIRLQYEQGLVLADVPEGIRSEKGNQITFTFETIRTERLRVIFVHEKGRYSGITELEVYPGGVEKRAVLQRTVRLEPGQMIRFPIEMVFDGPPREPSSDILASHLKGYNRWFEDQIPDFECSDPWFVKLWYHRWFLLRKSISFPGTATLPEKVFLTRGATGSGWNLDPTALPFQIREARWLKDPAVAINSLRAAWRNQYQGSEGQYEGQLSLLQAHRRLKPDRPDWAGSAPWELHLVHPNREFLEEISPRIAYQVQGMETRGGMNLEEACYQFSVVRALENSGFGQKGLAEEIRARVCPEEEGPAWPFPVAGKSILGLYAYSFGLIPVGDRRFDSSFDRLFDPKQFWAPFPARTLSKSPENDGETQMQANVLVLEALARAIREYSIPSVTRRRFFDFLQRMVHAQFEGGDFRRPFVGRALDSDSGEWKSGRKGHFETPYADLLIRFVGGLIPREDDRLEFFPLVDSFHFFRFRDVPYHGALLDIIWDPPDGVDLFGDEVEGYTVRRNGKTLFTSPTLRPVFWME